MHASEDRLHVCTCVYVCEERDFSAVSRRLKHKQVVMRFVIEADCAVDVCSTCVCAR